MQKILEFIWKNRDVALAATGYDGCPKVRVFQIVSVLSAIVLLVTSSCTVKAQHSGKENGHEYIDLGLSVKWATCNVGAASPEKYGDYYAWGETGTKPDYGPKTNKHFNGSIFDINKYNTKKSSGTVDNKTTLEPVDDVAHVNWGGSWRMPTMDELVELLENCTWTWTVQKDVAGYLVKSKKTGYEEASIFLPAAGLKSFTDMEDQGSHGYYWSGSLYVGMMDSAWDLRFSSDSHKKSYDGRSAGRSVRPVCP